MFPLRRSWCPDRGFQSYKFFSAQAWQRFGVHFGMLGQITASRAFSSGGPLRGTQHQPCKRPSSARARAKLKRK